MICPRQQGLQALGISWLEDYLLCFDTSTTAGTHETRKAGSLQQEGSEGHKICETGMQQSSNL